ncbi:probable galacturonosyltransferase 10 isoform X1 [Cryptomeria japonica]|uniref:probable galacturonosyltransferase 10 isoform X1 n=1 Tax=Cryptomeria japonica TaxID=3369 RepID=UPI0025ABED4A|nr:probable galacturonosyltransferase 10 isoform X1 [Cryptomeria japonica]
MSEVNFHLSGGGASRRKKNNSNSNASSSGAALHIDIDAPPKAWSFAPFLSLAFILVFFSLQLVLPATHYRHPFDPHRQWKPFASNPETANDISTNVSMRTGVLEIVNIFSWIDDLDIRPLAVIVNSTTFNSRYPVNIHFHFFLPDDLDEEHSYHKLKVIFPKSNIVVQRHNVIREKVKKIISDDEYDTFNLAHVLAFYIPKIYQNIGRFIYLAPDVVVKTQPVSTNSCTSTNTSKIKEIFMNYIEVYFLEALKWILYDKSFHVWNLIQDKVENLFQVDLQSFALAAVEDCSQNFGSYRNFEVINAIQRSGARPWVAQVPYEKNTCILDLSVLLVDAGNLAKENITETMKWWRKVLPAEGERGSQSDHPVLLALYGKYTRLDGAWNIKGSKFSETSSDIKILHFDGEKPWLKEAEDHAYTGMTKIWWSYISPLANELLRHPIHNNLD